MSYAIVYSCRTGNTRQLAQAVRDALPPEDCLYFGEPCAEALAADRLYIGFWTDKGGPDPQASAFLRQLTCQQVFLFGTAGFGGQDSYYEKILKRVRRALPAGVTVLGSFMCQGKMPLAVRQRYEKLSRCPLPIPRMKAMLDNFDRALSHPDQQDLENLTRAVQSR